MKMLMIVLICSLTSVTFSQKIVNGSFEINSASIDQINLSNSSLNTMLNNVTAFGSYGDVDIISSSTYGGGGPQDGKWYIALTGGRTDIVAMRLSEPLKRNKKYELSFYDRKDRNHPTQAISIGISSNDHSVGKMVFTSGELPQHESWTKRTCTFLAIENESFITVFMEAGSISDWVNIDHFTLSEAGESQIDTLDHPVLVNDEKAKDSLLVQSDSLESPDSTVLTHTEKKFVKFGKRKLNGRKYEIQQRISVSEEEISILVWDKNRVDGDIVSIYRNGELLAEKLEITKEKKVIKLKLERGSNVITVFAHNLGKIPPNTVAMGTNNKRYRCVTLVSDLTKSGSLEIIYDDRSDLAIN